MNLDRFKVKFVLFLFLKKLKMMIKYLKIKFVKIYEKFNLYDRLKK